MYTPSRKALAAQRDGEHDAVGDLNLHHPAWGGIHISVTDRNLEDLLSVVEEYGLQLLLKKGSITYEEARHQSTIDLVFAIPFIAESLISCKVSQDNEYGSDHYPIIMRFNLQTIQREKQKRTMAGMSNSPRHHSNSFKTEPPQHEAHRPMLECRHAPATLLKRNSNPRDMLWQWRPQPLRIFR